MLTNRMIINSMLGRFRVKDLKFSILLFYELFFIFVYPLVQTTFCEWLLHVSTVLILLFIKQLVSQHRLLKKINRLLFVGLILIFLIDYLLYFTDISIPINSFIFTGIYNLFFILYFFYTAVFLLVQLLSEIEPLADTLAGAASIFLLLGFAWTHVYLYISHVSPHAFQITHEAGTNDFLSFFFFSISRMVSLDMASRVLPKSSLATSLSLLQALTGTLYTAIITGEIVGLHLENKTTRIIKKNTSDKWD